MSATTELLRQFVGVTPDELLFQNRLIEEGRTPAHTPMVTDLSSDRKRFLFESRPLC
jgi:hypothetical protein